MDALFRLTFILLVCLQSVVLTLEAYDCETSYATWQTSWTPGWKAWCCLNHHKGCEATFTYTSTTESTSTTSLTTTTGTTTTMTETSSTSSRTTSTMTSSTQTSSTVTTATWTWTSTSTISPEEACKVECDQGGSTATCGDRLMWVSLHVTQNEADACAAAQVNVVSDCPEECGRCTAVGAGCGSGVTDMELIMKRYEMESPEKVASQSLFGRGPVLAFACVALLSGFSVRGVVALVRSRRAVWRGYGDIIVAEDDPALALYA